MDHLSRAGPRTVVLLASLFLAAACDPAPQRRSPPGAGERPSSRPSAGERAPHEDMFVVWTRGGLPETLGRRLEGLPGVERVWRVTGGLHWIPASDDLEIPVEVAYVGGRRLPGMQTDGALSRTGARLRSMEDALTLTFDGVRHRFTATVSDEIALGFEAVLVAEPPDGWGSDFYLVRSTTPERELRRVVRDTIGHGSFRLHDERDTSFLRHADAVEPPMYFKKRFGEFAAGRSGGRLQIDPRWTRANIVTRDVPLLGPVTCHRELIPLLAAALTEVRKTDPSLVDPGDFAGCYSPRFIGSDPTAPLSAHAWGAAVDLNASANPQGEAPRADPALVRIMGTHGFTWGGTWLLPDGMHFEWARFSHIKLTVQ